MRNSTIYVQWGDDLPESWRVALTAIESKHPEYEGRTVTFDKMPSCGQWGWVDEGECSGSVAEAFDSKDLSKKYPALTFNVEPADITADEKEKSFYEGWLVTVTGRLWNREKFQTEVVLHEQYALIEDDTTTNGFAFVNLNRVDHPKIETGELQH